MAIACLSLMPAGDILVGGNGTVTRPQHSPDPQWAPCCVAEKEPTEGATGDWEEKG